MGSGLLKETSGYRPILMASFALNYAMGGLDVFGYHLLNFFLHSLCSFSIFFITLFFLRISDEERLNLRKNQLTALFAALVFAVHPAQTESVTYITGRSNLLSAFFFLISFWAYIQYGLSGKFHQLFISSFSYVCALLVKESAVTLLIILILFNFLFPLGRTWKRRLFSLFPHLFLTTIYLMIRIHFLGSLEYYSQPICPLYENLLTQLRAWVHYVVTLAVPLNLNVDYDFAISHSVFEGEVILSFFILSSLAIAVWKISKVSRPVGFFALWFAINLLPTNSLIALEDVVTDRWLYLPSVGYAVIVALAAEWLFRTKIRIKSRASSLVFFFLCILVVELYGFATVLRNFTWTSYWTLWEDAAFKSPNKSRPHIALGLALFKAGHTDEAIAEFHRAIQLDQKAGIAYLNLGYIYHNQGKLEEAIQALQKAVIMTPRLAPEMHNNLAIIYLQQGRKEEGLKELQRALEARPHFARAYSNFGNFFEKEENIDQAIFCMEKAAKLEPEYIPVHQALSRLYEKKGWKEKSREAQNNFIKYAALGAHVFLGE
jgi:tetratricopeptide (TPR) repeat protein